MTTQINHHFNLSHQDLVEIFNIRFNIGAGLIYVLKDGHFLLDDLDALLATRVVLEDQLLLFFQDLLNNFFVVLGQSFDITGIFYLELFEGWHTVTKFFALISLSTIIRYRNFLFLMTVPILSALKEFTLSTFHRLTIELLLSE